MKKFAFVLLALAGCMAQNSSSEDSTTTSGEVQESLSVVAPARGQVAVPDELSLHVKPLACGDFDCNNNEDCQDGGCGRICLFNAVFFGTCGVITP